MTPGAAAVADLQRALAFGVTTELDQFMSERTMGMIKRRQAKGRLDDHADLRSAGTCATPPGGHGTEYGLEIPTVSSPEQAAAWIDARVAAEVDWIKIIYDDGHAFARPFEILDEPTLIALIDGAHEHELRVVVHVSDLEAARTAIEAGADGALMLFAQHHGARPATQRFEVGPEWTRVEFELAEFGLELWDLTNVFVGSTSPGEVELRLDELRFDEARRQLLGRGERTNPQTLLGLSAGCEERERCRGLGS